MADRGDDVSEDDVLADRVEEVADSLEHGYNDYAVSVLRKAARRLRGGDGRRARWVAHGMKLAARWFRNLPDDGDLEHAAKELERRPEVRDAIRRLNAPSSGERECYACGRPEGDHPWKVDAPGWRQECPGFYDDAAPDTEGREEGGLCTCDPDGPPMMPDFP